MSFRVAVWLGAGVIDGTAVGIGVSVSVGNNVAAMDVFVAVGIGRVGAGLMAVEAGLLVVGLAGEAAAQLAAHIARKIVMRALGNKTIGRCVYPG